MNRLLLTLLFIFIYTNSIFADDLNELMDDIGNEVSIGVGAGWYQSRNEYLKDNFESLNFYRVSISSFIGSRDMQLRALFFGHYSNGYDTQGSYVVSADYPFLELNGNLGFAIKPLLTNFFPCFSLMGSFNYYYMKGEKVVDPGIFTSAFWNFPIRDGLDTGFEIYNNYIFEKINNTTGSEIGNSGDWGMRVYVNFIGTISKGHREPLTQRAE